MTSCYSYKVFPKEYRNFEYSGDKRVAFVTNPELKKENRILQQSGIFVLTSDSLTQNCLQIKLHRLDRNFVCGQPILASAFTLGQLPVYFPDRYYYQFDVIDKGETTLKKFDLLVATRYWFWDLFLFDKNFPKKAGKALLANYYSPEPIKTVTENTAARN
jgi:hypothetical protein